MSTEIKKNERVVCPKCNKEPLVLVTREYKKYEAWRFPCGNLFGTRVVDSSVDDSYQSYLLCEVCEVEFDIDLKERTAASLTWADGEEPEPDSEPEFLAGSKSQEPVVKGVSACMVALSEIAKQFNYDIKDHDQPIAVAKWIVKAIEMEREELKKWEKKPET
jgi:transcription elongation factor Elf1